MRLHLHRSGGTFVTSSLQLKKKYRAFRLNSGRKSALRSNNRCSGLFGAGWMSSAHSLKKAVEYAQGQRSYMENYLKDPRCEISNNRAENKIRPFTVGRKNWLFSDTPAGARASAVIYSIVETAKANNLSPRDYIQFLFENLPDMEIQTHPERLKQMLPWGKLIQENFV